jgi:1-deoxy-D-xylulose 5-phosphate reductoisomerase
VPFVSGGMGRNRNNPDDYVLRSNRGKVHAYLKRQYAEPVTDCHIVVYTKEAYLADPDIDEDPNEADFINSQDNVTHVLVAVLASSGVSSKLSPYRFVKNLAGGNHEALVWSADEIREKAKEIAADVDDWCIVAD